MTEHADRGRALQAFLLNVAEDVWGARRIHAVNEHYTDDVIVRSPMGLVTGREAVQGATLATLAECPDLRLLGEDVITAPDSGVGAYRHLVGATHAVAGAYGKASGTKLRYRILGEAHVRDGQIDEDWVIRDQAAIVRQLGLDPLKYTRDMLTREGGVEGCVQPLTPLVDRKVRSEGQGNDDPWGQAFGDVLRRIMTGDLNAIPEQYDPAVQCDYPGGETGHGWAAAERFWMGVRAAFPTAEFTIEHQIGCVDQVMPPRAAIRWSLHGKHDGWGAFGAPTGAEVYVMGMSQVEFGCVGTGDPKIRREWTLFDEIAIWKQILIQTGNINRERKLEQRRQRTERATAVRQAPKGRLQ